MTRHHATGHSHPPGERHGHSHGPADTPDHAHPHAPSGGLAHHTHPHGAHGHAHAPHTPPAATPPTGRSLLMASSLQRVLGALGLIALLWMAVAWAVLSSD